MVYHITKHIKSMGKYTKNPLIFASLAPNYYDTLRRMIEIGPKIPIIVARGTEFLSVRRSYLRLSPKRLWWYIVGTPCSG